MMAYNRTDSLEVLGRGPALVLTGDRDQVDPWRRGQYLVQTLGRSTRLVVVPGAGHMVNLTHHGIVNAAPIDLLDEVQHETRQGATG